MNDKERTKLDKLARRVESVGRVFFKLSWVGSFQPNRVYLHGTDIWGHHAPLPVFRSERDLLIWSREYIRHINTYCCEELPIWKTARIEEQQKARPDENSQDIILEQKAVYHWIQHGKDQKR